MSKRKDAKSLDEIPHEYIDLRMFVYIKTTLIVTVVPYWLQTLLEITHSSASPTTNISFVVFLRGHPPRQRQLCYIIQRMGRATRSSRRPRHYSGASRWSRRDTLWCALQGKHGYNWNMTAEIIEEFACRVITVFYPRNYFFETYNSENVKMKMCLVVSICTYAL